MRECSAVQYIPELWADAVYMELAGRESVVGLLLEALATGTPPAEKNADGDEDPILVTAKAVYGHVEQLISDAKSRDRPLQLR